MRRLTAYRERYTQAPTTATFGRLTIVEKYRPSTTSNNLALAFRFVYNFTKYAVVLSKKGGDALSASNLTSLGVGTDEVVINIVMKRYKLWLGLVWYIEQPIAPFIASITGMQVISISSTSTQTTTILQADTAALEKQITSIANINATYINSVTASTQDNTIYTTVTNRYDFFDLDLDDKTSIGISYQGFNPEAPDQIGFKFSNSFNIPRTSNNDKLTGYGGLTDDVYSPWFVNYIIDNEKLISNGRIKVTDIDNERISCSIAAKSTIWDRLKQDNWANFMFEVYNEISKPQNGSWDTFIQDCIDNTNGVTVKAFYGDLFGDSELSMITRESEYKSDALNEIVYKINGYEGGQFVIPVKKIFDRILVKYGVNFISNSTVFSNISPYIQSRYFNLNYTGGALGLYYFGYFRGFANGATSGIKSDKGNKTVYDFVKEFIIHSGCLVDIIDETTIALNRMDDLLTAPIVDFSGNIEKDSIKFSPAIDGVAQNNIIDFAEYSKKIQKGSLQINLPCFNQNVETTGQFLELKEFAPPAFYDRDKNVLGLFEDETWNNFTFLQDSGNTAPYTCLAYFNLSTELSTTKTLAIAKVMDIGYALWSQMIKKPKKYTIKKWLTTNDFKNIKLFQRYWIEELQGYFMLLKVNGMNPEKSNAPTEFEFVKIPEVNVLTQFAVSPTSFNISPSVGIYNLQIYASDIWDIVENVSWLSVSKNNGITDELITITVTGNTGTSNRTGSLIINSDNQQITVNVKQNALVLSPSTLNFDETGGTDGFTITTKGSWTAVASDFWIVISKSSGTDNDTIDVTVPPAGLTRSGTVTVTNGTVSKVVTINQTV